MSKANQATIKARIEALREEAERLESLTLYDLDGLNAPTVGHVHNLKNKAGDRAFTQAWASKKTGLSQAAVSRLLRIMTDRGVITLINTTGKGFVYLFN